MELYIGLALLALADLQTRKAATPLQWAAGICTCVGGLAAIARGIFF